MYSFPQGEQNLWDRDEPVSSFVLHSSHEMAFVHPAASGFILSVNVPGKE